MAHVTGQSRYQIELVAPALDDLVGSDHPVRVIDAFVETLDLRDLGFSRVDAEATGRPPYAPETRVGVGTVQRIKAALAC